jgi:hypothetical protein
MTAVEASNTQVCTVGTEHTLTTLTGGKTYLPALDLGAARNGDCFEVRAKSVVLAAGTTRVIWVARFRGQDSVDNMYQQGIPVPGDTSAATVIVTLKQVKGAGRSIPWKVLSL